MSRPVTAARAWVRANWPATCVATVAALVIVVTTVAAVVQMVTR